jgi:hypothetical protein
MTQSAHSAFSKSIAFKYVMASEPYKIMAGLPYIKIYLFKNNFSNESKMFSNMTEVFLIHKKKIRKVCNYKYCN